MSTTLKEKHHKKVAPQVGYLNHPEALDNIPETVVEDIDSNECKMQNEPLLVGEVSPQVTER